MLLQEAHGGRHVDLGAVRRPGGGQVVGWINTDVYDETGDEQFSQGWCPTVIDTNGDGRIT